MFLGNGTEVGRILSGQRREVLNTPVFAAAGVGWPWAAGLQQLALAGFPADHAAEDCQQPFRQRLPGLRP